MVIKARGIEMNVPRRGASANKLLYTAVRALAEGETAGVSV